MSIKHLTLTPNLPNKTFSESLLRAASSDVVKKQLEKEAVIKKWNKPESIKQAARAIEQRKNDFAHFNFMLAKK